MRAPSWATSRATWRVLAGPDGWLDLAAPSALARPGWPDLAAPSALARPGWLDLAAPSAAVALEVVRGWGTEAARLRHPIHLGDWPNDLARPGYADRPGRLAERLAQFGCPTNAPSTRLAKKNRCAAGRPASTLPASLALHRCFMPQI